MAPRFSFTLNQLSYFAECARTLNMTVASQELHVAQSAVSTAISLLERAIGTPVFIRMRSKGLELTPAGERLLLHTERVFAELTEAVDSIAAEQQQIRGTVRLAFFNVLTPFLLPQVLSVLRAEHPELTVEVLEGDYEETLAALRSGAADLAVHYRLTDPEDMHRENVGQAQPHIIVHSGHPLAGRGTVALAELKQEPFVLLDLPGSSEYLLGMLLQAGVTPRLRYRSTNYETVRTMVASGAGFSLLNQRPHISHTYSGLRTTVLEIADTVPSLPIAVAALKQSVVSARGSAVIRAIRGVLAGEFQQHA